MKERTGWKTLLGILSTVICILIGIVTVSSLYLHKNCHNDTCVVVLQGNTCYIYLEGSNFTTNCPVSRSRCSDAPETVGCNLKDGSQCPELNCTNIGAVIGIVFGPIFLAVLVAVLCVIIVVHWNVIIGKEDL